jgi:hypothetical protein
MSKLRLELWLKRYSRTLAQASATQPSVARARLCASPAAPRLVSFGVGLGAKLLNSRAWKALTLGLDEVSEAFGKLRTNSGTSAKRAPRHPLDGLVVYTRYAIALGAD